MSKRLLSLALAIAAIGALVAGPAGASDPPDGPPGWLPEIPYSDEVAETAIVKGVMLNEDGTAVVGGRVQLLVWPPDDVMEHLDPLDNFNLVSVAKDITEDGGKFWLRIPDDVDYQRFATSPTDSIADFEVVGWTDTGLATFNFSRDELKVTTHRLDITLRPNAPLPDSVDPSRDQIDPTAVVVDDPLENSCSSSYQADLGPQLDVVGQVFNSTDKVSARWTYATGAESALGVGYSANAAFGSWKSSGTKIVTSSASLTFPTVGANTSRYHDTWFRLT